MPISRAAWRRLTYEFRGGDCLVGREEEVAERQFHLVLSWLLCWVLCMVLVVLPLFAVRKLASEFLFSALVVAIPASLVLLRKGRARPAKWLFVCALWVLLELISGLNGGIRSPGTGLGFAVVLAAAWLLGRPAALRFAVASLFISFVEAFGDSSGHRLPSYFPGNPASIWAAEAGFVSLTLITVGSLIESLEHKMAALRDSEERFRSLSDASFEGIMIHEDGLILEANLTFARLFGYERVDELIGINGPETLLTPESRERVTRRMAARQTGTIELAGYRKDGASILVETESRPAKYRGREARIVAFRDVTDRRREQEENVRLQAQLHQANKMESIGRLAGGVAHDFNNLLTVIHGYGKLLAAQPDHPSRRTYASQIEKASEMGASLTRQLLAFSRSEVIKPQRVHLNTLIGGSVEMLQRLVGEHVVMTTELKASPDEVLADPNHIRQCLMNLAANARDAMPGGGTVTIQSDSVELTEDEIPPGNTGVPGPYVRLTVNDSGTGMDEMTRNRVFEPFFTTKPTGSGVGLGLSVVFGIISQWSGFITVSSNPGKGSQFSAYLPLDTAVHVADTKPSTKTTPDSERFTRTVLVVEDQDMVREFVIEALLDAGYVVLEARNSREALAIIEDTKTTIHAMLTDLLMPGMSGKALAMRARCLRPLMKALIMTGNTDHAVGGTDALDATDEVILKPFAPEDLESRLRMLLHADLP